MTGQASTKVIQEQGHLRSFILEQAPWLGWWQKCPQYLWCSLFLCDRHGNPWTTFPEQLGSSEHREIWNPLLKSISQVLCEMWLPGEKRDLYLASYQFDQGNRILSMRPSEGTQTLKMETEGRSRESRLLLGSHWGLQAFCESAPTTCRLWPALPLPHFVFWPQRSSQRRGDLESGGWQAGHLQAGALLRISKSAGRGVNSSIKNYNQ